MRLLVLLALAALGGAFAHALAPLGSDGRDGARIGVDPLPSAGTPARSDCAPGPPRTAGCGAPGVPP